MLLAPFYRQANQGSGDRVMSLTAQTWALNPGPEPALPQKSGRKADHCSPGSLSLPFSPAPLPAQTLLILWLEKDPADSSCTNPLRPSPAQRERRTRPACLLLKGAVAPVRPMIRSGDGQPMPRGEAPSVSAVVMSPAAQITAVPWFLGAI